jgi:hypothetical protein
MHDRRTIRTALAGISIKNIYVPELAYPTTKKYINLKGLPNKKIFRACGVIDIACTIFAFKNRSYLGECETEFKKARESGAQGVLFYEKNRGSKIS